MHLGKKNLKAQYSVHDKVLEAVDEECDLGVLFRSDLKATSQCARVVKTANIILGMIKRTFTCKNRDIIIM